LPGAEGSQATAQKWKMMIQATDCEEARYWNRNVICSTEIEVIKKQHIYGNSLMNFYPFSSEIVASSTSTYILSYFQDYNIKAEGQACGLLREQLKETQPPKASLATGTTPRTRTFCDKGKQDLLYKNQEVLCSIEAGTHEVSRGLSGSLKDRAWPPPPPPPPPDSTELFSG
jgi:hypothetical protein